MTVKLEETVTVRRQVPQALADLVFFAQYLRARKIPLDSTDEELIRAARAYWNQEHGDDD